VRTDGKTKRDWSGRESEREKERGGEGARGVGEAIDRAGSCVLSFLTVLRATGPRWPRPAAAGETSIGELRGRRPRAISANGADHGLLARGDEWRASVCVRGCGICGAQLRARTPPTHAYARPHVRRTFARAYARSRARRRLPLARALSPHSSPPPLHPNVRASVC